MTINIRRCPSACSIYNEEMERIYKAREELFSNVVKIPLFGPLIITAHDQYLSYEINSQSNPIDKGLIRKTAIKLLEKSCLVAVVQSVALTVIYSLITYFHTKSLYGSYTSTIFCGLYTLMTLPNFFLISFHNWKLEQESHLRKQMRMESQLSDQYDDRVESECLNGRETPESRTDLSPPELPLDGSVVSAIALEQKNQEDEIVTENLSRKSSTLSKSDDSDASQSPPDSPVSKEISQVHFASEDEEID